MVSFLPSFPWGGEPFAYRSGETLEKASSSAVLAFPVFPFDGVLVSLVGSLVCIRKLAVRTNWPTAAQKPLRKALKGC